MASQQTRKELETVRRPLWILAGILLGVLALSAFSQWTTTVAANNLDVARTARAMHLAMDDEVTQIKAIADDNAHWDDAAEALYLRNGDRDFGKRTWDAVTDIDNIYQTLFVIKDSGEILMSYENGLPSVVDYRRTYGPALSQLTRLAAQSDFAVGGFIGLRGRPHVVAVAKVTAISPTVRAKIANHPNIYLVVSRPISVRKLAVIAGKLQLDEISLSPKASHSRIRLKQADGTMVGQVGWAASKPGNRALMEAWPSVGLALLLALLLLGYCFEIYRQMRRHALIDALSGLPNRVALETELLRILRPGQIVALAFLDLDGFKSINDSYGHGVGDQLIRDCARLATALAADCKMVARLGGDEFAVLAHGADAKLILTRFAELLLHRLSQPFDLGGGTIMIGVSIGLAVNESDANDVVELMRRADIAMYASKRAGKMRITLFDIGIDQKQAAAH